MNLQTDTVALRLKKGMEGLPREYFKAEHFVSLNNGEIQSRGHAQKCSGRRAEARAGGDT